MIQLFNADYSIQVIEGLPLPTIHFLRNGRELLKSSHEYIHIDGGRMTIMGVQDADSGTYNCVAESIAGRAIETAKLEVGSQSTKPHFLNFT